MASRVLPGLGLQAEWALGEDGWKPGMDENLRKLSALVGLEIEAVVTVLPAATNGQFYIVTTGDNAQSIAMRDQSAWVFYPPRTGQTAWDKDTERSLIFNGTAWADPYALLDAAITEATTAAEEAVNAAAISVANAREGFDSIAAAETFEPPAALTYIKTLGYYLAGDDGGSMLTPTATAGKPGGLTLMVGGTTPQHFEISGRTVNLEALGCVPGDVSLSVAEDNSDRINDMGAELSSRGGGTLVINEKRFQLGKTVRPFNKTHLKGYGMFVSFLESHPDWNDAYAMLIAMTRLDTTLGNPHADIQLSDFNAKGHLLGAEPTHSAASSALYLEYVLRLQVRRVAVWRSNDAGIHVSGYKTGIEDFSYFNRTVNSVTVTNGGTGYSSPPTVVFTGGGFSGDASPQAVATAVVSGGAVTAINVTNGGAMYGTPTISFTGGGGSGAAAVAVVGDNPLSGGTYDSFVEDCDIAGGAIGIELVGNATCDVRRNRVRNAILHGLRMAGGGRGSYIEDNYVMNCLHTALYMDFTQGLWARRNTLVSTRPVTPTAISIGQGSSNLITDNFCVGMLSDVILNGTQTDLTLRDNVIQGDAYLYRAQNFISRQNRIRDYIRYSNSALGLSQDDLAGGKLSPAAGVLFDNLRVTSPPHAAL